MRLRCALRTVWGTVTMPLFWRSLIDPPLVVFSGHVWPYPEAWSEPRPSLYPEDWPGLIEVDESRCVDCGHREEPPLWRAFYS